MLADGEVFPAGLGRLLDKESCGVELVRINLDRLRFWSRIWDVGQGNPFRFESNGYAKGPDGDRCERQRSRCEREKNGKEKYTS